MKSDTSQIFELSNDELIKRALENKNINIFGNGKQVRDVLNVKDLAKLIVLLIKNKDKVKGNALNIGYLGAYFIPPVGG